MQNKPSDIHQQISLFVEHNRQGDYFTLPFTMPPDIDSFSLAYTYERHHESESRVDYGRYISRQEDNIIDLGLIAPVGTQVGASGSDKLSITISEVEATPGYHAVPLTPGVWQIIVGAYKVAEAGVNVVYDLTFTPKSMRLLKGDLHTHTLASDGVLRVSELAQHAQQNGLDFLAITDHNQAIPSDVLPGIPGLTLIPGIEWTHYKGHASFLGVDEPYDGPFMANSFTEVKNRFGSAHSRGAFISIDHPCDPVCPFQFDMDLLPFDCLEVWNGPMRGSNLQALGLWQNLLLAGKKIPICGGSDYHRDSLLLFPGGPATCVYAMSAGSSDILDGLRRGHAYIVYSVNGPKLTLTAGQAMLGDSVDFSSARQIEFEVENLSAGDVVQVVTAYGSIPLHKAGTNGALQGEYVLDTPGFARLEVLRSFLPGLPLLPALISNPIYFDA